MVFLELRRDSRVTTGNSGFLFVGPGSPIFHSTCQRELGVALESLQGKESSSRLGSSQHSNDEFVGEKVVSQSYSSTILGLPSINLFSHLLERDPTDIIFSI